MAKCFIVLGAHLSGLEAISLCMSSCGVFCDTRQVSALHNRLLNSCGASWDDPKEVVWNDELKDVRDNIVEQMGQHEMWTILDPLTPFTLRGWLEVLDNYKIIGTIRDPKPYAKLISEEYGFVYNDCISIWRRYNDKIVALEHEFGPFPSVNFSSETFDDDVKELFHKVGLQ